MIPPVDNFPVTPTDFGEFTLRLVDPVADLALIHRWMHAEHVVPFWQQAWPKEKIASYLHDQLTGDVSRPCLGVLDGQPVSYWEIYRAEAEPVGRTYPAAPDDLGVHLLIGERERTGQGLGTALIRAVRDGLFARGCPRVVAEPDVRNLPSIRAFAKAGFTRVADVTLPDKTAALMISEFR